MTIIGGATFENGVVEAMSIEDATVTVENFLIEHPVNINQVDVDVQYITVPSVFLLLLFLHSLHLNSINFFKISKVSKKKCCDVIISDVVELTPAEVINEKGETKMMYIENIIPKIPAPPASAASVVTTAPVVSNGGSPGQNVNISTCSPSATAALMVSTTVTGQVVSDDSSPSQKINISTCGPSATAAPVASTTVTGQVVSNDSGPSQDITTAAPVISTSHRSSGQ